MWVVVQAVKRKRLLWLTAKAARFIALNLRVDRENKTWTLTSKRMFAPQLQSRNYEDIADIFKSDPDTFKVSETRTADGKFKSFTVETV